MSTCKCSCLGNHSNYAMETFDGVETWIIVPWGSWGQRWPGSRRWQFYKVEEAGRSISKECPGDQGSNLQFFAMIPISNLAVAGDVDHGKRSVGPPAETEHCHHDNHLVTWCKHRTDWCTLACSNLRRTQILNDAVISFLSGNGENFYKHSQRQKGPWNWVNSFDGFY